MKKNIFTNKIFVFLLVLFSILILFTSSVFASTDTISFTGFDGNSYEILALPDGVNNYKHFVMLKDNSADYFYVFCFNETLKIVKDDYFITFNPDDYSTGKIFTLRFPGGVATWSESGEVKAYSFSSSSTFIYSCEDIMQYAEQLNSDEDFFFNPPTVKATGILAPIVQDSPLEEVMKEIIVILPIVLMTIVGLIGLRKALAFLSTVLHRS